MPIKHDLSHLYALKSAIEGLLGYNAWYELKETTSLSTWRKYILKILKAIQISIYESIEVTDAEWLKMVEDNIAQGEQQAKSSQNIDELLSCFTATLLRQVFLQIGGLPNRKAEKSVALSKANWRLNSRRSVQYVQSKAQLEFVFWCEQQDRIGHEKQMELHNEHRRSKSELPYSEWCRKREA
ncbi:hypothetical protein [Candidatus Electronema sp. TJ]|uniref:hypothetical protein n=1 Tax=Candidatus Electronema sp. TJ TaxID=3401573 RepID=UPI003AA89DC7